MVRTAINVYSVRDLDDSVPELVERVAEAGYDGVQFSGNHTPLDGDPEAIAAALERTGLAVTPAHIGIDDLEGDERRDDVRSAYETVGVEEAVVPYLPPSDFGTADDAERTAARLDRLSDALDEDEWSLHYHNHDHEFTDPSDGPSGFEALIDRTGVGIELDVGWAQYAGRDPVELIETHGHRMPLVHMKDVDTSATRDECFREIGEGDVDMGGCARAAREAGAEWLIYEHDDPEDPLASIDNGAAFLDSV